MTQINPPPLPPPSGFQSPVIQPIVVPAARGGGFARAMFTTLALSVFGLSLSLNIYLLVAHGIFGGDGIVRSVLDEGRSAGVVAVVPLDQEIGRESVEGFLQLLRAAADEPHVKAVVVEINTPGGTVGGSERIHAELIKLKAERNLPVIVAMGDLATSGGYYIACAADHVIAQRTTWTGNIGVLLPRISLARLADRYGIEDKTIISTGADFKDAGSIFKDDTPEETAYWTDLADQAFVAFKDVIVAGRRLSRAQVDEVANGKVYTGSDALKLKLVDQVGNLDDAVVVAAGRAGVSDPKVIRFSFRPPLLGSLGAFGSSAGPSHVEAEIGGAKVRVTEEVIGRLFSHRPMYLFTGH